MVPEAAPPVQTLWQIAIFSANFAKTLIFLPNLVVWVQIWYQMKAYMLHLNIHDWKKQFDHTNVFSGLK